MRAKVYGSVPSVRPHPGGRARVRSRGVGQRDETCNEDISHDLPVARFFDLFERGVLTFDRQADFSISPDGFFDRSADPRSEEYRLAVMRSWSAVTGREQYEPSTDESFPLDDADFLAHPYPYSSASLPEVGRYFGAIAALFRRVALPLGSHVVELGAGWGNLAMMFASAGMRTTAVDLNSDSVELLRRRAAAMNLPLTVLRSPFLEFELDRKADAIIFFEAFHHCDRPLELLDRCVAMLNPGGRLIFVADAIYDEFHAPWGLRLDGSAVYVARRHGWLELGFDRAFFYRELLARGLDLEEWTDPDLGAYGGCIVATRRAGDFAIGCTVLPPDEERTWGPSLSTLRGRFTTARSVVSLEDRPRATTALVTAWNHCRTTLKASLRVSDGPVVRETLQPGERAAVHVPLVAGARQLEVCSELGRCPAIPDVRVGIYVESVTVA